MITREKIKHHIAHLEEKHRKLDQQIDIMESAGSSFSDEDLVFFKKKRLALRDEIEEAKRQLEFLN